MKVQSAFGAAAVLAMASAVSSSTVFAHNSMAQEKAGELKQMVEQSNLVVTGTVSKVKYVNAQVEGGGEVPYTFVTYKLKDSVRGKPSGESLTLRFLGGSDGKGGFLKVSGVPTFQEGEQDVLFISGNGEDDRCPLVNCAWGRYRIHQNRVYNTQGQPVRAIRKNNAISRGKRAQPFRTFKYPAPSFDALKSNPDFQAAMKQRGMSEADARKAYETRAPKQIVIKRGEIERRPAKSDEGEDPEAKGRPQGGKPKDPIGQSAISSGSFISKVKQLNAQARRKPTQVRSANAQAKIVVKKQQGAPAGRKPPEPTAAKGTAEEEKEIRELKEQGFDPVLKKE